MSDTTRTGESWRADTHARSFGVRWRVEMRAPLGPLLVAFDVYDRARANYLVNQLVASRRKLPHTLHYPVTLLEIDNDNNTLYEAIS